MVDGGAPPIYRLLVRTTCDKYKIDKQAILITIIKTEKRGKMKMHKPIKHTKH